MLTITRALPNFGTVDELVTMPSLADAFAELIVNDLPKIADIMVISPHEIKFSTHQTGTTIKGTVTYKSNDTDEMVPMVAALGYICHWYEIFDGLPQTTRIPLCTRWELHTPRFDELRQTLSNDLAVALAVAHLDELPDGLQDTPSLEVCRRIGEYIDAGGDAEALRALRDLVEV